MDRKEDSTGESVAGSELQDGRFPNLLPPVWSPANLLRVLTGGNGGMERERRDPVVALDDRRSRLFLAVRVLNAVAITRVPVDPDDATALQSLAESEAEQRMALDELACAVITRERRRSW